MQDKRLSDHNHREQMAHYLSSTRNMNMGYLFDVNIVTDYSTQTHQQHQRLHNHYRYIITR
jgi:hypothetical protein